MSMLMLACKSILNRRFTVLLTLFSIALSIMLLLAVERLRSQAQESFTNTLSGTDLIVGARSGTVQLLLYSVFRMGDATNNISWQSYEHIAADKHVAWAVPLSLGDSHRGFRVLATNENYFVHYRYARDQHLQLAQGKIFADKYDAVIGADVAQELNYQIGQDIILAHGTGEVSFAQHADKPFRIAGILRKTGTPVDRTVHITLAGLDAMHEGWDSGAAPAIGETHRADAHDMHDENSHPANITAVLVGLNSKLATFRVQRAINEYAGEPLLAIMPGVALQSLWDTLAIAQQVLRVIAVLVVLVGISGMVTVMLA
ncbi:MAG: ABC transporter permease, partial [Gammaproteobacteria bacterium]|nr:ABC transporter permease [Gammaproteobacteria bacterium]